jgi:hypothetical protein
VKLSQGNFTLNKSTQKINKHLPSRGTQLASHIPEPSPSNYGCQDKISNTKIREIIKE